ncbi:hypothetical protein [Streptomyces griseorubiginosus]|uniref:hypothetical protein n=1 Tax=Streptomyces griseorubiginosus TaxID=67304 RepID=UPI001AD6B778|nr:hypothetical protein [Streptomyces griseorubiginosus]MBO4254646.1 hypothetical protein [Streptomyces griseorubiginosus]
MDKSSQATWPRLMATKALLVVLIVATGALLLAVAAFLGDRRRDIWIIDAVPAKDLVAQEHPGQQQNAR